MSKKYIKILILIKLSLVKNIINNKILEKVINFLYYQISCKYKKIA